MVRLPLGGLVEMKTAVIRKKPNYKDEVRGPDTFTFVDLYIDGNKFGELNVSEHSIHYAKDVVENWESGILKEDNKHIIKENV